MNMCQNHLWDFDHIAQDPPPWILTFKDTVRINLAEGHFSVITSLTKKKKSPRWFQYTAATLIKINFPCPFPHSLIASSTILAVDSIHRSYSDIRGLSGGTGVKNLPANAGDTEMRIHEGSWSLGQGDPLEGAMVTHSNVLAWRIHGQRNLVCYSPWGHRDHRPLDHQSIRADWAQAK